MATNPLHYRKSIGETRSFNLSPKVLKRKEEERSYLSSYKKGLDEGTMGIGVGGYAPPSDFAKAKASAKAAALKNKMK